jgi:hypothetical protein
MARYVFPIAIGSHSGFITNGTVSHSVMEGDPFGRAIHDYQRGELDDPLIQRDGGEAREHPIEENYFGDLDPSSGERGEW